MTPADTRRGEILAAARALLLEEGYQATSMRRVASRLRITPTALYLYFRNKEELINRLMQDAFAILLDRLSQEHALPGQSLDRLRRGMEAYIRFGLAHPDHYRVAFMLLPEKPAHPDGCRDPVTEQSVGEQCFAILYNCVDACIADGVLRPGDACATAEMLWGMMHGVTSLVISFGHHLATSPDQIIQSFLETTLRGLAPDS